MAKKEVYHVRKNGVDRIEYEIDLKTEPPRSAVDFKISKIKVVMDDGTTVDGGYQGDLVYYTLKGTGHTVEDVGFWQLVMNSELYNALIR